MTNTDALHERLVGLPMEIQESIIESAMGQYISYLDDNEDGTSNDDWIAAYKKWRDSDDSDGWSEVGMSPWEPFEDHDQASVWEHVDSAIYAGASHAKHLIALGNKQFIEQLEALGKYIENGDPQAIADEWVYRAMPMIALYKGE